MKILENTKTAKSLYSDSKNKSGNKTYLVTFLLICSIVVILYLSMLTLSAHQFHHSLQRISSEGNPSISVERLVHFSKEKAGYDTLRNSNIKNLPTAEKRITEVEESIKQEEIILAEVKVLASKVESDERRKVLYTDQEVTQDKLKLLREELLGKKCGLIQSVIDIDNDYISSLDKLFEETGLGRPNPKDGTSNSYHLALGKYISLYDEVIEEANCPRPIPEIRRVNSSKVIDKQLTQMLAEYRYFNSENTGLLAVDDFFKSAYIKMPRSMLTILVVLLMGALGGLITLVRALMSSDNQDIKVSIKAFLFTPLLGSVTAFAIFVLAKAGVLVVSDAGSEGGAYLSPFFVSFLGLISGLLSIDALDTITDIAKRWFVGSAKNIERWYTGSAELLEDPDAISVLAILADFPDQDIRDWLSMEKSVPYKGQTVIAAAMKKPRGAIFTDIKP